jgi:hypothetical protein
MNQIGGKMALLGASFVIVAMLLMTEGKTMESPAWWLGAGLIIACLVLMNVTFIKLHQKARSLSDGDEADRAEVASPAKR